MKVRLVKLNNVPPGKLLLDGTVAPQDISFSTDFKLLNRACRKREELIDILYISVLHGPKKTGTYRQVARKMFLKTQKKTHSANLARKVIG